MPVAPGFVERWVALACRQCWGPRAFGRYGSFRTGDTPVAHSPGSLPEWNPDNHRDSLLICYLHCCEPFVLGNEQVTANPLPHGPMMADMR